MMILPSQYITLVKPAFKDLEPYVLSYHSVVVTEEMNVNNTFVCMERALILYLILVYFEL